MSTVVWFRRDLRRRDHPALLTAVARTLADGDGRTVPLFVLDPAVWGPAGPVRRAYLVDALAALRSSLGGQLLVRSGDPVRVVAQVAAAARAQEVHVTGDHGPYGARRDAAVATALRAQGARLVPTGSAYAVAPGRVRKADGSAYRVYTPFYRAWRRHGWRAPAPDPVGSRTGGARCPATRSRPGPTSPTRSCPGGGGRRVGALAAFSRHRAGGVRTDRNRPDLDASSRLSHHLKWGELHPRSLLAGLGGGAGEEVFRKELAWREFYADVLARTPDSARRSLDTRFDDVLDWDEGPGAEERFALWSAGRTGYPFVDAGMRQLLADGWMHNRVRMVTASFLVKDLHLPWQRGARWFMARLVDADLASNQHGWQWTAGCGTDAAPYHRVFNPVLQGQRFDPDGDYVRRYLPELRHLAGATVHEPWTVLDGLAHGYPERVVDHHEERDEALRRFAAARIDAAGASPAAPRPSPRRRGGIHLP